MATELKDTDAYKRLETIKNADLNVLRGKSKSFYPVISGYKTPVEMFKSELKKYQSGLMGENADSLATMNSYETFSFFRDVVSRYASRTQLYAMGFNKKLIAASITEMNMVFSENASTSEK